MERPLSQLKPGQHAIIKKITPGSAANRRLREMGVIPGSPILVERVAPLGDPVEITIKGYHLSLRRNEAAAVVVEIET